ncbi:MAG TPA: Crp/Fnr family transcriptional regulator [Stellaceae bacterium]|jgi:CRP-like cAMP-binding protein|nr:Crp/Fnr family transcriptional regulator [Stellaceae bacterium]
MYGSSQRQILRRSHLFARLADNEVDEVLGYATVSRYAQGDQIFAKGDPGNAMMAVLKGRVMITVPSLDGRQVVLTIMRDGDVFGEIALLDGKDRTADATAAADCELLTVPRRSLFALLERRPDLCFELLIVLCERLRRTNEQVEDLAFLDLEARIAKVLVRLAEEAGRDSAASGPVGVKISQRALGELVGGSRESVNKHLQDMKRAGLITIEKGAILICNPEGLAGSTEMDRTGSGSLA